MTNVMFVPKPPMVLNVAELDLVSCWIVFFTGVMILGCVTYFWWKGEK